MKDNVRQVAHDAYRAPAALETRRSLYSYATPSMSADDVVLASIPNQHANNILDVGCGNGALLLKLAKRSKNLNLTGIDLSRGLLSKARQQADEQGSKIKFHVADVQNLPFPSRSFDWVSSMHMLYHVPDIPKALREISRILSPAGSFVVTTNSIKTKPFLRSLIKHVTPILGPCEFTSTTDRFSLEDAPELVCNSFGLVETRVYESVIRLTDPLPYLDYFDSMRGLWSPLPNDTMWQAALLLVENLMRSQIAITGCLEEPNVFGAIFASHPRH